MPTATGIEVIAINGVDYVRADSIPTVVPPDSSIRIVVLQRGWVAVGYYTEDGDRVLLDNASVIRRWGTTKGLGELVNGPTSRTILEPAGHIEAPSLGVVLTISVDDSKWIGHL